VAEVAEGVGRSSGAAVETEWDDLNYGCEISLTHVAEQQHRLRALLCADLYCMCTLCGSSTGAHMHAITCVQTPPRSTRLPRYASL
jgi:hypothetical protein